MKAIATNGEISAGINDSWDFVNLFSQKDVAPLELYAKVAAAYTAVNRIARAMASMPFVIMKGKEEIDSSAHYTNALGYFPKPRDLFRRIRQSITFTNTGYLRMGKNIAGYPKKLNYVLPTSIRPITSRDGELLGLERTVNGQVVKIYPPDDPELIRFWYLDFQTELLPSPDTEFKAISSAAGILFYSDFFTRAYFQRGGIKPTLIAMKGLIGTDKKADMEKDWTKFIRGIGRWAQSVNTKVFNAENMDIRPFGDGLGDLKDNPHYRQSIENIALGLDMPISILLSNAANYATAEVDQRVWWENSVIPWFEWIAEELNEQVLFPLSGARLEPRPETKDSEQSEEVERASAIKTYAEFISAAPTAEIALGILDSLGAEITDDLKNAINSYFADKKKPIAPIAEAAPKPPIAEPKPAPEPMPENKNIGKATEPIVETYRLTVGDLEELRIWREVAVRRWKGKKSLEFPYRPHATPLPNPVAELVIIGLASLDLNKAITQKDIEAVFDFNADTVIAPKSLPVSGTNSEDMAALVKAINDHAAAMVGKHAADSISAPV